MNINGKFDIVYGPNKDALFDACKYAHNKETKIGIYFTIAEAGIVSLLKKDLGCTYKATTVSDIKIYMIGYEDDWDCFNMYGYCKVNLDYIENPNADCKSYHFEASYNARLRKGQISFVRD